MTEPMSADPLSLSDGLRRCFGNKELLHRLLRLFVDQQRDVANQIELAIRGSSTDRAIVLAHGLVSRAGAIGATPLSGLASVLENALRDSLDSVAALAATLREEHGRVLRAASDHLRDLR